MSIAVILNPRSRANRLDPALAARMTALLGTEGRVLAVPGLPELDAMTAELALDPPAAIAIHGGDGTVHKTLSSLVQSFKERPLPPVAILPAGTMNVVGSSLSLLGPPEQILGTLLTSLRGATASRPLPTVTRHCLKVDEAYGFVFGCGLIANFLEEYYSKDEYGTKRALWILARMFFSGIVDGPYSQRIVRRFAGKVMVDGRPLPWQSLTGVGAATVREVGLGFKLNHRADEDPDRFSFLAIHAGAVSLGLDLWGVHRGTGVAPHRAFSGLGQTMRIEPEGGACVYTVDGDLYKSKGAIEVSLGPSIRFFAWKGASAV
ncbi:MAG TPA: diacylglycerol kinase family protein [Polyangia bacterium]